MLPPASPGKERARSGSLKSFEFQLPLSSLPPRGAPLQSRSDDLRSPGSGRSFTSTESEPAQSAPPSTPRPRSQSLTVMAIQNKKAAVPRSSLALPISALNLPRTQSSPRAAPQLGPGCLLNWICYAPYVHPSVFPSRRPLSTISSSLHNDLHNF